MITIDTYQDSLDGWRVVINSDENTLAELPVSGYGYDTKEKATNAAAAFLRSREEQGLDVEGGGIRRHITPHKGGRTVKRTTDVTPATQKLLEALREAGISLGDLVEVAANTAAAQLLGFPDRVTLAVEPDARLMRLKPTTPDDQGAGRKSCQ